LGGEGSGQGHRTEKMTCLAPSRKAVFPTRLP
jgi:hypothetical protein